MSPIRWERLPLSKDLPDARAWVLHELAAGLTPATVEAYSRALEGYLAYCRERRIVPHAATAAHVHAYLDELGRLGLGWATRRQRLTAIRLFYAFVVEQGGRADNPAATAGSPNLAADMPVQPESSPWVPKEDEWRAVLAVVGMAGERTRIMFALAYVAALSREELCQLRVSDLDLAHRRVLVAPSSANGRAVPLDAAVIGPCAAFVQRRLAVRLESTALFLSASPRNRDRPLSIWTWSKVVQSIAAEAGVAGFTTHTPRNLRLLDLARSGWSAADIARFAGHRNPGLARRYVRLADEEPAPDPIDLGRVRGEQLARLLPPASA